MLLGRLERLVLAYVKVINFFTYLSSVTYFLSASLSI